MSAGKSRRPTSRSLTRQPVCRMRLSAAFMASASCECSARSLASFSYGTMTPPIIMMRAATAVRSWSSLASFLRQSMASTRKGSSSRRARSASVRVKNRCSGSGASSCSGSSSWSAMCRPGPGRPSRMLSHRGEAVENEERGSTADENHGAVGRNEIGLVDAMAGFLFEDDGADAGGDVLVRGAFAQEPAQIVILPAEKAGAKFTVGGETNARAEAAEGLRDGSNETDFAGGAVGEAILAGGFAALVGNRLEGPLRVDPAENFGGGHDGLAGPVAVRIERHEFDEAHDDGAFAGEGGEGLNFIVIPSADEDGIDLCGSERGGLRRI